jgi:hypothetical protein
VPTRLAGRLRWPGGSGHDIYFAMAFSVAVEMVNLRLRKKANAT